MGSSPIERRPWLMLCSFSVANSWQRSWHTMWNSERDHLYLGHFCTLMCKEISQYTSMQLICPHLKLTWLPRWLSGKESGDVGSIPGSERSPGEGNDNPLQYSCLEHPMDRGPWHTAVHGVSKELDTTERLNSDNTIYHLVFIHSLAHRRYKMLYRKHTDNN